MRISTNMIYDGNIASLNNKTASLLNTQQQLSSGKRILTPADDPVAAAQVLETTQTMAINNQYQSAQGSAASSLGLIDSQLSSVTDLLTHIRTLGVQAGNATLNNSDRKSIATELRSDYDQLMSIANSKDGNGQYLFSGYQGNTQPFAGTVENGVTYSGDDGQRTLRVSGSRLLPVSVTGSDLFLNAKEGNGTFVTGPQTATSNSGTGVIDDGNVIDPTKWASSANSGNLAVTFWKDPTTSTQYYDLVDSNTGISLFTNTTSTQGGAGNTFTHAYSSGTPISFSGLAAPYNDFGASVTITGTPASGDSFNVTSSKSSGLFATLSSMIKAIEAPSVASSANSTLLSDAMGNLSHVEDNVLRVRAGVGASMSEVDDLKSLSSSLDTQYQARISDLQDVDYNKAITDLTRMSTELQATQQSFAKIAGLSLFNYLP